MSAKKNVTTRNFIITLAVITGVVIFGIVGYSLASPSGIPIPGLQKPEQQVVYLGLKDQDKANMLYAGGYGIYLHVAPPDNSFSANFVVYPYKNNDTLEAFVGQSLFLRNGTSKVFWFNSTINQEYIYVIFFMESKWYSSYNPMSLPSHVSLELVLDSAVKQSDP